MLRVLAFVALAVPASSFSLQATRPATLARACASQPLVAGQRSGATCMQEGADAPTSSATIEFIVGVPEPCVPDVQLTRSRDGSTGVATFTFDTPSFLSVESEALGETTGMYLKDAEGTLKTSEVTATFTNGRPRIVKGVVVMQGADEWDRFMRFMERYAEQNGLGFNKA